MKLFLVIMFSVLFVTAASAQQCDCRSMKPDDNFMKKPHECKITDIALFSNRMHVRCEGTPADQTYGTVRCMACGTGIWFFAVPMNGADKFSDTFVAIATTAMQMNKPISIGFRLKDKSGEQYGCGESDCRRPLTVSLRR